MVLEFYGFEGNKIGGFHSNVCRLEPVYFYVKGTFFCYEIRPSVQKQLHNLFKFCA